MLRLQWLNEEIEQNPKATWNCFKGSKSNEAYLQLSEAEVVHVLREIAACPIHFTFSGSQFNLSQQVLQGGLIKDIRLIPSLGLHKKIIFSESKSYFQILTFLCIFSKKWNEKSIADLPRKGKK